MRIGNRAVGTGRVFIIAEIGSNHCQSLDLAVEHIRAAAEAGADAAKFQCLSVHDLYHKPSQQVLDLHRRIDLPEEWIGELARVAQECGIEFMASATYPRSVRLLAEAGVNAFKLASAQVAVCPQLVEEVARLGMPTILSTGLVETERLDKVVRIFEKAGNSQFIILHCNSVYPAPAEIVHLGRMDALRRRYECLVGFSDHTRSHTASIAATAMNASVIERHFALSRKLDSPDAPFSSEPAEFALYCSQIRETEILADYRERTELEPEEQAFLSRIGNYLMSTKAIPKGSVLDGLNVTIMRGSGLVDAWSAYEAGQLRARVSISAGEWILPDQVDLSE